MPPSEHREITIYVPPGKWWLHHRLEVLTDYPEECVKNLAGLNHPDLQVEITRKESFAWKARCHCNGQLTGKYAFRAIALASDDPRREMFGAYRLRGHMEGCLDDPQAYIQNFRNEDYSIEYLGDMAWSLIARADSIVLARHTVMFRKSESDDVARMVEGGS